MQQWHDCEYCNPESAKHDELCALEIKLPMNARVDCNASHLLAISKRHSASTTATGQPRLLGVTSDSILSTVIPASAVGEHPTVLPQQHLSGHHPMYAVELPLAKQKFPVI